MKQYLLPLLGCLAAGCAFALTPEEAGKFPPAQPVEEIVFTQNFKDPNLRLKPGFDITPEGDLHFSRTDPNSYDVFTIKLPKLIPRGSYILHLRARAKNLTRVKGNESAAINAIEMTENGQWIGGLYQDCDNLSDQWRKVSQKFNCFDFGEGINHTVVFFLPRGYTGDVWYDDVMVTYHGQSHSLVLTRPDRLTFDGEKNVFAIHSEQPADNLLLHVLVTDASGRRELLFPGRGSDFKGDLGKLAPGEVTLETSLVDPAKQVKLCSQRYRLQRLDKPVEPSCRIDEHGRAIVDGKPFLPIGIYIGSPYTKAQDADWEEVARTGFNCVLDYDSFQFQCDPKTGNQLRDIKNRLDYADKLGLKVIFSLVYQYDDTPQEAALKFGDFTGNARAVAGAAAGEFSRHPALLAWYLSDEKTRESVPEILALREAVAKADPRHPAYTLTNKRTLLPYYGVGGDIIGYDRYPLNKKKDRSIRSIAACVDDSNLTGLPCWVVLQINNTGIYDRKIFENPDAFRAGRFPTAAEMRAMPLLSAIHGAKGFLFYSYFDIMIKTRRIAPDIADREWKKVVPLAPMLRELAPFLLSLEKAPEVRISGCNPKDAEARAFVDGKGNIRVLIVGTGNPVKAVVTVPGFENLKSKYGQTRNLGGGRYEFTASEADGDILNN